MSPSFSLPGNPTSDAATKARRWFGFLTRALIGLCLLTMLMGPLVRAESAGLACPDWPLCHGHVVPWGLGYQVALEFGHRAVAGCLSLVFLGWLLLVLTQLELRKNYLVPALLALALLTSQVLLGMLTITEQLDVYVVNSHLLNAVLLLSVLTYIWKKSYGIPRASIPAAGRWIAGVVLVMIFLQLFLGGRVSTHAAGRVCSTFPACYEETRVDANGEARNVPIYFPRMIGSVERHMTHRFMAYALVLAVIGLAAIAERQKWPPRARNLTWILAALIAVQIFVGALNVILHVPVTITVVHSGFAYAIFLSALILRLELGFDRVLG